MITFHIFYVGGLTFLVGPMHSWLVHVIVRTIISIKNENDQEYYMLNDSQGFLVKHVQRGHFKPQKPWELSTHAVEQIRLELFSSEL